METDFSLNKHLHLTDGDLDSTCTAVSHAYIVLPIVKTHSRATVTRDTSTNVEVLNHLKWMMETDSIAQKPIIDNDLDVDVTRLNVENPPTDDLTNPDPIESAVGLNKSSNVDTVIPGREIVTADDGLQYRSLGTVSRATSSIVMQIPKFAKQALASPQWKTAMDLEYEAMMKNETWHLVDRQPGVNVISSIWLFKVKEKADGLMDRLKACLVVNSTNQVEDLDHN